VFKTSPEWVTGPEQGKSTHSGRIATFSLWTGIKYMRRTAGYTWTDYKTNTQLAKDLKITTILDKLVEYKRNWIQHVNRMPGNRLPRVMKYYCRLAEGIMADL
jgi:hypothetical protein